MKTTSFKQIIDRLIEKGAELTASKSQEALLTAVASSRMT